MAFSQENTDNLLKQFKNPPPGYGPIPFYWWSGGKLSVKQITNQLDLMKTAGFSGVNINYTHTAPGYTYLGEPQLFSKEWWILWGQVVDEAKRLGMYIGFDDYLVTHGSPEHSTIGSKICKDAPQVAGQLLRQRSDTLHSGEKFPLQEVNQENVVSAVVYRLKDGKIEAGNSIDLISISGSGELAWEVPGGDWYVSILFTGLQPFGAMNPLYAQKVIEYYFKQFKRYSHGQMGSTVNYFFQDELTFGGTMPYWSPDFQYRFLKMKGYDIIPELTALFNDIGKRTVKIRLDYYDVATQMMEEAYFKPVYDWCQNQGIIYGHDQVSRADVISGVKYYGDYFRTMRWYQAPGTDRMPVLLRGKVTSSISHLYDRPRTWFEAYHSQGWGVTPADITKWDYEALIYGYNLFSYHSCYYTTLGGWWAWAPGDITFRQPYWSYFTGHYHELERLCYLLSRGKHQSDVAILFPASTVQADMNGTSPGKYAEDAKNALSFTGSLFKEHSIDFILIDDESIARSEIKNETLNIAGASYKVLILPEMRFIRFTTLKKISQFYDKGGKIVALGCLPVASDRIGGNDTVLDSIVNTIFGKRGEEVTAGKYDSLLHRNGNKGTGYFLKDPDSAGKIAHFIGASTILDFNSNRSGILPMHRRTGGKDIFALYNPENVAVNANLDFNLIGVQPEEWDAKTGETKPVDFSNNPDSSLSMNIGFEPNEFKIIVFRKGTMHEGSSMTKKTFLPEVTLMLDTIWNIRIEPLLNNCWGDFRSPAGDELIGVETLKFRYKEEPFSNDVREWSDPDYSDKDWYDVVASYGPRFLTLGPIRKNTDLAAFEMQLKSMDTIDLITPVQFGRDTFFWRPAEYSLRWGILNDPVLTSQTGLAIHGPIGYVPDEMLHFNAKNDSDIWYVWTTVNSNQLKNSTLAIGTRAAYQVWFNGQETAQKCNSEPEVHVLPWNLGIYPYETRIAPVMMNEGNNPLVLKLKSADKNSWVRVKLGINDHLKPDEEPSIEKHPSGNPKYVPDALVSSNDYLDGLYTDFDCFAKNRPQALWYRFKTPPGMKSMLVTAHGRLKVWLDGQEVEINKADNKASIASKYEHAESYIVNSDKPCSGSLLATIRIEPATGYYGGAALPEPVRYSCGTGQISTGDWSEFGMDNYSGSIRYTQHITIDTIQSGKQALLSLGDVACAAKVWVNRKFAGNSYMPPWKIDISGLLKNGENQIEVSVANTLANHYSEKMPSGKRYIYKGQEKSGLFGPVTIHFTNRK